MRRLSLPVGRITLIILFAIAGTILYPVFLPLSYVGTKMVRLAFLCMYIGGGIYNKVKGQNRDCCYLAALPML